MYVFDIGTNIKCNVYNNYIDGSSGSGSDGSSSSDYIVTINDEALPSSSSPPPVVMYNINTCYNTGKWILSVDRINWN